MSKTTELWILDNMDEGPYCPNCQIDLQKTILDRCFGMNKERKWSSKVSIMCPHCRKIVQYEVEWIPEYVTAKMIQV